MAGANGVGLSDSITGAAIVYAAGTGSTVNTGQAGAAGTSGGSGIVIIVIG